MEYNEERQEYHLTIDDVINNLPITHQELKQKFGDSDGKIQAELNYLCTRVYEYMFELNDRTAIPFLKYKIDKNLEGEQQFLKQAFLRFVHGAYLSDMDLNEFADQEKVFPEGVYRNLKNARLTEIYRFQAQDEANLKGYF